MKQNCNSIFFYLTLTGLILLAGCRKDEDTRTKEFRVTGYSMYTNGTLEARLSIEYANDRIVAMHESYPLSGNTLLEQYRTLVAYPDDSHGIMVWSYLDSENKWVEESRDELTFLQGSLSESVNSFHNGVTWVNSSKFSREFEGEKLIRSTNYDYDDGNWVPEDKAEFQYDGEILQSVMEYSYGSNQWMPGYRSVITYKGDLYDYITESSLEGSAWADEYRMIFRYEGDQVIRIDDYDFVSGEWIQSGGSVTYTYDDNGNVATWTEESESGTDRIEFTYEEGSGNWLQLIESQGGDSDWLYLHATPMPAKAKPGRIEALKRMFGRPAVR